MAGPGGLIAAALAGLGLALAVLAVLVPRAEPRGVARSLQLIHSSRPVAVADVVPLAERGGGQRIGWPLLRLLARWGRRITPAGTPKRWRHRLDLAGNSGRWTSESLLAAKAAWVISLGGVGLLTALAVRSSTTLTLGLALTAIGYWAPDLSLYNAGLKRQERIRRALPDAVDMLVVCVEAGLGLDAATLRVAQNSTGPLAQEFARVLQEMQFGRSRAEAFGDLAARSDIPELRTYVTALVQADRLGVPVAGVLREQAAEMRLRRRQRAEERAQKVPVKIVFPVLLCIFPAFFVVVIGPGAIRITQTLLGH